MVLLTWPFGLLLPSFCEFFRFMFCPALGGMMYVLPFSDVRVLDKVNSVTQQHTAEVVGSMPQHVESGGAG